MTRSGTRPVAVLALVVTAAAAITVALAVLSPATKPPTPSRDPSAILPVDPVAWADVVWTKVDDPVGLRAGPLGQRMDFVVAGGPGLVAGGMTSIGVPGAETALATIWVSETGDRWTPALFDAGVQAGDFASISKMAAGSRGIVAWGGVCCLAEEQAVWWSGDGIAWERRPLPDDFGRGSYVLQVAAGPDGFAAAGGNNTGMAIWTSADGRSWKPVDLGASGAPGSMLSSIRRTDDGWLAVGVRNNGNTIDGAVWRSSDLDGWQPIPDDLVLAGPEDVDLSEVHAFAGGYLATGITGAHEDRLHCEGVAETGGASPWPAAST